MACNSKPGNGLEIWWIGSLTYNLSWVDAVVCETPELTNDGWAAHNCTTTVALLTQTHMEVQVSFAFGFGLRICSTSHTFD